MTISRAQHRKLACYPCPNISRVENWAYSGWVPCSPKADGQLIMVVSGAHSEGQHAAPQQVPHTDVCDIAIDSQGKPFMT